MSRWVGRHKNLAAQVPCLAANTLPCRRRTAYLYDSDLRCISNNNNEPSHEPDPHDIRLATDPRPGLRLCPARLGYRIGGGQHRPRHRRLFRIALEVDSLPDHMVAFNLYYNHYKARKFNISSLGGELPDVEIESTAVVPRIDYLSPLRVAGGRAGIYIAQPWIKQEVSVFGLHDTREGMGDTTISPIVLWDMGKNLTLAAAVEITVPTGEYSTDRLANTSNNFYTYKPLFSFTWLPTEDTEVSMKSTYSFNRKNKDTDYRSGQIFHFDYSASYRVTDNLRLGLNGYYLKQTTDDKQYGRNVQFAGQDVDDGVRGQVFAIGPALHFTFLKYASAEIRWAKEFDVENRPEGEMLWAKISIPFAF